MADPPDQNQTRVRRLMWISKTRRESANERRRYEIKFLFAALTLFVLVGAAFLTGQASMRDATGFFIILWIALVGLAFALLTAVTTFYLGGIHVSNNRDLRLAHWAEEQVREFVVNPGSPATIPMPKVKETRLQLRRRRSRRAYFLHVIRDTNYSWRFQTLLLAVLGVIAWLAVILAVCSPGRSDAGSVRLRQTPKNLSFESAGVRLTLELDESHEPKQSTRKE